jgi:hypothetical protein
MRNRDVLALASRRRGAERSQRGGDAINVVKLPV